MEGAEPAAARPSGRLRRVGGVRGHERGLADPRRARQRGRLPHRPRRRLHRHVLPVLRPDDAGMVDLLGRQPPAGAARSARDRLVQGIHRCLRGGRHVQREADPGALHLVAGRHRVATLGAGILGRRRRDLGDQLGHRLHARRSGGRGMSAVHAGYRHLTKEIATAAQIELGDSVLKWYDIAPADEPVPGPIRALARGTLRGATDSHAIELDEELGFVILHRCGESFYFLLVSTWRNDNELWETVWAKTGENDFAFRAWPIDGTHRPTFCVWELGAVCHEQRAWTEYLCSERAARDRDAYLQSTFEGV